MSTRALIVDDHPIVRDALVTSLDCLGIFDQLKTANSLQALIEQLSLDDRFQLLILDLSLTDTSGSRSIEYIREHYPQIPILIFSAFDSTDIITQCFEYGVQGFVSKNSSMQTVVDAIRVVLAGGMYIPPAAARSMGFEQSDSSQTLVKSGEPKPQFTPKQQEVFEQLLLGLPNKVIATELNIAEGTVKTHLHSIYQILRVNSRAQAILKSRQLSLIN
jgi:DNA-binding NarL/FixJ family response regulator